MLSLPSSFPDTADNSVEALSLCNSDTESSPGIDFSSNSDSCFSATAVITASSSSVGVHESSATVSLLGCSIGVTVLTVRQSHTTSNH